MNKLRSALLFLVVGFCAFAPQAGAFGIVAEESTEAAATEETHSAAQTGISSMAHGSFYKPMSTGGAAESSTNTATSTATSSSSSGSGSSFGSNLGSGSASGSSFGNHGGLTTTKSVSKQQNTLSSTLSFGKTKLITSGTASSK